MKPSSKFLLAFVALVAAAPALADWSGKGEFGFVMSRGNSDAETLNAKIDASREVDRWKHSAGFSALRASADDETTANRYELRGQTNYALTDRSYVFGALRYEDDRYSAYDYQATASAGYGYKFIDTEATKLAGQLGVGYRVAEVRLTGEREDDAVLRGDLTFQHRLTDTTRVLDKFLVEAGSSNTFLQNELSVEVKMTDRLALSVAYALRHNTDVPAGVARTDQLTTANVVFAF
jgi:putative salt-induced outer membrane protein